MPGRIQNEMIVRKMDIVPHIRLKTKDVAKWVRIIHDYWMGGDGVGFPFFELADDVTCRSNSSYAYMYV